MWTWIIEHSNFLGTLISAVLMVVWIIYLNLFLFGTRRSQRPMIMLSRGGGKGPDARLFISNMGAEPIYITALIADCECKDTTSWALITKNDDISGDDVRSPEDATNEGPLGSGQYMDAGSFRSIMQRIALNANNGLDIKELERVTLTVVAASGYGARIAAGRKSYTVIDYENTRVFHPEHLSTEQLRGRKESRRLTERLNKEIQAELDENKAIEARDRST